MLEAKKTELILGGQSTVFGYIPEHKRRSNFLDYYDKYVKNNSGSANRHFKGSLTTFIKFLKCEGKDTTIFPGEITEELCKKYQTYLLDNYNGETPHGYFTRFKRVLKSAQKDGYFKMSPAEDIKARVGRNKRIKEIITKDEYAQLMKTPCTNYEIKKAFIFSLYTGLRWADVKPLTQILQLAHPVRLNGRFALSI